MRLILTLFVFLLMSACSTPALKVQADPEAFYHKQATSLASLSCWNARGAMGVHLCDGASYSMHFNWKYQKEGYQLALSGPLGFGYAQIDANAHQVSIKVNNQDKVYADSAEHLMQAQMGWSVPVSGLVYWLKGIAENPLQASLEYSPYGTLSGLKEQGWQIDYSQEQRFANYIIPARLHAKQGCLAMVLSIKQFVPCGLEKNRRA